jgi:hypothetical protein
VFFFGSFGSVAHSGLPGLFFLVAIIVDHRYEVGPVFIARQPVTKSLVMVDIIPIKNENENEE